MSRSDPRGRTLSEFTAAAPFAVVAALCVLAVSSPLFRTTPRASLVADAGLSLPIIRNADLPSSPATVSFIAVGDIMPGRYVEDVTRRYGYDFPYAATHSVLQAGDIVFANLESPLTPGPRVPDGGMVFRADVENAQALRDAGITVVSLANNHMMNAGADGIADTLDALDAAGILHAGAGLTSVDAHAPVRLNVNGVDVALVAYVEPGLVPPSAAATVTRPGLATMDADSVTVDIGAVRQLVDVVIVSMHAGTEYTTVPTRIQRTLAHAAIDAGADVVIGHHSHWVQEIEEYGGGTILYGLGNFVFDQMWSQETQEGVVATFTLTQDRITDVAFRAVRIDDRAQPHFVDGNAAASILTRLTGLNPRSVD